MAVLRTRSLFLTRMGFRLLPACRPTEGNRFTERSTRRPVTSVALYEEGAPATPSIFLSLSVPVRPSVRACSAVLVGINAGFRTLEALPYESCCLRIRVRFCVVCMLRADVRASLLTVLYGVVRYCTRSISRQTWTRRSRKGFCSVRALGTLCVVLRRSRRRTKKRQLPT